MTCRDNEGRDNGVGDRGGHGFDGWSGSESLGVDFSFTLIARVPMLMKMVVLVVAKMVSR